MPRFEVETPIQAPINVCFDLARDIDFHVRSLQHTGERAVAGVTSGLIGLGESVTWEAKHFGVVQHLTSKITVFEPKHYFQDTMTQGAFQRFQHDHHFESTHDVTTMRDTIEFASPFGPMGWCVDQILMTSYLRRLITDRAKAIRDEAEHRSRSV